jgi:hypothetical protein
MTPRTRQALFPTLLALTLGLFSASLRAAVHLEQSSVIGFPVDGVRDVIQTDSDGTGAHRLAVLNPAYLTGLQWSPQRGTYDQIFFVQLNRFNASSLVLADLNGDGHNDLVVAGGTYDDAFTAYDSLTGAVLKTIHLPTNSFTSVIAADVDGMPGDELILAGSDVSAYKGERLLWQTRVYGDLVPRSHAAAQRGELFLTTGTELIVLDARTGAERRRLPFAVYRAYAGQSDFDDNVEIVGIGPAGLQLIDSVTGAVQWTAPYDLYSFKGLWMFDADGNGLDDVIVRSGTSINKEAVEVLDGTTGRLRGSKTFESGGSILGVTSGCEPVSIAAVEGAASTLPDQLWLLDAMTLEPKARSSFDGFGTTGFAIGDFDGAGLNEVAIAHDGTLSTLRLEPYQAVETVALGSSCCTFRGMVGARPRNDGPMVRVVAGSCGAYLGCITAWAAGNPTPLWKGMMDDGEIPRSVTMADADGDGVPDAVSMSVAVHSGAKGQFVYAYRGTDGKQLWRSVNIPGSSGRVRVADVGGTGTSEVLARGTAGLVRLRLSSGAVSGFYEFTDIRAFATYQRPGDSRARVVVATSDRLFILDDGQVITETRTGVANVTEIEVADIDADGVPEVLIAQEDSSTGFGSVHLQVRSIETLEPLWTSEEFPQLINFGQVQQIDVGDVDNDGAPEVLFLSSLTLRVFKTGAPATRSISPRFGPTATIQSTVSDRSPCCATVLLDWSDALPGGTPPLRYRIYRSSTVGGSDSLIATTSRSEFTDLRAGGSVGYRYSIEIVNGAGEAVPGRLTTTVAIGRAGRCVRPAGKR